ncbi:hypothetical protein THOM_0968 [Trachipleistophora hominis]|uniref:Uncharacterized protein n=1 Tax=Trachipleistophora hominis TaxID=72359 RepID=L7JX60_TRAHO|nr:hypothetical protein THOM_0968 [Trachipleistophora hominis]
MVLCLASNSLYNKTSYSDLEFNKEKISSDKDVNPNRYLERKENCVNNTFERKTAETSSDDENEEQDETGTADEAHNENVRNLNIKLALFKIHNYGSDDKNAQGTFSALNLKRRIEQIDKYEKIRRKIAKILKRNALFLKYLKMLNKLNQSYLNEIEDIRKEKEEMEKSEGERD